MSTGAGSHPGDGERAHLKEAVGVEPSGFAVLERLSDGRAEREEEAPRGEHEAAVDDLVVLEVAQ